MSSDVVTAPHHQKEAFANFKVNISHRATASRLYSTHPVVPSQLMPVVSQWTGKVRKNKHFFAVWIARTLAPRLPHMRMYILRAIYLPNPPISTPACFELGAQRDSPTRRRRKEFGLFFDLLIFSLEKAATLRPGRALAPQMDLQTKSVVLIEQPTSRLICFSRRLGNFGKLAGRSTAVRGRAVEWLKRHKVAAMRIRASQMSCLETNAKRGSRAVEDQSGGLV